MARREIGEETSEDRASDPILALRGVSKAFDGNFALEDASLELRAGEIRGLVGVNGSGKSTLIKIIAGYHEPEPGAEAWLRGEPFDLGSRAAAERAGMRFIHQDLGLVGSLSAVDNLALGHGYQSKGLVSIREEARLARAAIAEFGFDFDVRCPIDELTQVERSGLAITRALRAGPGEEISLLVLDEPTESLGKAETERLFEAVRRVAARGAAVIYISHRLDEVLAISQAITVLRDGLVVADVESATMTEEGLVGLIIGREIEQLDAHHHQPASEVELALDGVSGAIVDDVSLDLHRGEVLGIAGLAGSGREELPYLMGGARPLANGELRLGGAVVELSGPRQALREGVVFVASDRQRESAFPELLVRENLTMPRLEPRGPLRWLGNGRERRASRGWLERLDVRPPEPDRKFATLSGGNQQKAVLARALRCSPRVIVIDEPVQGVDVGAKLAIHQLLLDAAADGISVVIASNDADDLALVCDRVVVMGGGRVVAELTSTNKSADQINAESLRGQGAASA